MDQFSIQDFNNPPAESILSSKFLDADFLLDKGIYASKFIFTREVWEGIHTGLIFFSMFFIAVIIYSSVRLLEMRAKEREHLEHEIAEYAHHLAEKERKIQEGEGVSKNERWRKVLNYIFSPNEGDWKLAVIEADSMLDSLMTQLGFKGEDLGEKLKSADREKFRNLSFAWEVHTIRNRIAHEGTSFGLSQHEAKRVIALYEQIFREFSYI